MDERAFGELTKRVAGAGTRRGAVRALAGGLSVSAASMAAGARLVSATDVEGEAFGFCRPPRARCGRNKQCCAGRCKKNGTCACNGKGAPCINRVGIVCCSGKCREGSCE
jgi:hypothetical protein